MFARPLQYQRRCPLRQRAADDTTVSQFDQCFMLRVQSMEVRRAMIPSKHLNHNAIENADRRHKGLKTKRVFSEYYARSGFASDPIAIFLVLAIQRSTLNSKLEIRHTRMSFIQSRPKLIPCDNPAAVGDRR